MIKLKPLLRERIRILLVIVGIIVYCKHFLSIDDLKTIAFFRAKKFRFSSMN